jgi:hypothetical protein
METRRNSRLLFFHVSFLTLLSCEFPQLGSAGFFCKPKKKRNVRISYGNQHHILFTHLKTNKEGGAGI